jgi:hypothetical protein
MVDWSGHLLRPLQWLLIACAGRNEYRTRVAKGRVIGNIHENPELPEMKNN